MKTTKIIFWITTGIIVAFDGLIPLLTSHTEVARQGVAHLGYPDYFPFLIMPFKVLGALALVIPSVKGRYKEWAYAGFGISFICAAVSHGVIDGMNFQTFFPLIFLALLVISYIQYDKLQLKHP